MTAAKAFVDASQNPECDRRQGFPDAREVAPWETNCQSFVEI